jgi:uroporphyrinogen III methyltransferase/synthase
VAAIGPATAAALDAREVVGSVVPAEYRAEGLVERLRGSLSASDRVLLPRAAETRDVLVRELTSLAGEVVEVPVYRTRRAPDGGRRLRELLASGEVDVVTFTSSSTVRGVVELLTGEERARWLETTTIASIGPITAATAAEYGLRTHVMPAAYTIPALAQAIANHFATGSSAP